MSLPEARWVPIAFAVTTFFSTAAGGIFALHRRRQLHLVMSAAAGLLVGAALLDLLPEAAELAPSSRLGVTVASTAGFALFLVADRLMHAGASAHREEGRERAFGSVAALGLTIHSLLDGVAIGAAFHADAKVGVLVGVAVVAHDFGDGVSTVAVVLGSKGPRRASMGWLAADAVAPVVGALLALEATVAPCILAGMLAFFGGSFLFLGAGHLLPEAAQPGRRGAAAVAFVVGIGGAALVTWLART